MIETYNQVPPESWCKKWFRQTHGVKLCLSWKLSNHIWQAWFREDWPWEVNTSKRGVFFPISFPKPYWLTHSFSCGTIIPCHCDQSYSRILTVSDCRFHFFSWRIMHAHNSNKRETTFVSFLYLHNEVTLFKQKVPLRNKFAISSGNLTELACAFRLWFGSLIKMFCTGSEICGGKIT